MHRMLRVYFWSSGVFRVPNIALTPKPTLSESSCTCYGLTFGSNLLFVWFGFWFGFMAHQTLQVINAKSFFFSYKPSYFKQFSLAQAQFSPGP